jgi:hypothetical protein
MDTDITTPHAPPGRPRRRHPLLRVLVGVLLLGLVTVLGLGATAVWLYAGADQSNVGRLDFANQLNVPPLLAPHTDATGTKTFDLRLQAGTSQLLPNTTTPTARPRTTSTAASPDCSCWTTHRPPHQPCPTATAWTTSP